MNRPRSQLTALVHIGLDQTQHGARSIQKCGLDHVQAKQEDEQQKAAEEARRRQEAIRRREEEATQRR